MIRLHGHSRDWIKLGETGIMMRLKLVKGSLDEEKEDICELYGINLLLEFVASW